MLEVKNLSLNINNKIIFNDINFSVWNWEILTILWHSWSWKSSILKSLAWFYNHQWNIFIDNVDISNLDISKRNIVLSFQEYLLFPHLTVYKNIDLINKSPYSTNELLKIFKIEHISSLYPKDISWGEQQRVSIARAISSNPKVLLLDEPFSNLDWLLKKVLRNDLKDIFKNFNIPIIIVIHDKDDAFFFSEKILILNQWKVLDYGNINKIFFHTDNKISAELLWDYIEVNDSIKKLLNNINLKRKILRPCELILYKSNKQTELQIKDISFNSYTYIYKCLLNNSDIITLYSERFFNINDFLILKLKN